MEWIVYLAIIVVSAVISIALAPKPPKQKPYLLEDVQAPTAERDRPLGWLFGERVINDPNFVLLCDFEAETRTRDKVKTVAYSMGFVLEICKGPVDAVTKLFYDTKVAWSGNVTSSQQININLPELFGGRDKEGGIAGDIDIQFGEATQAVNAYLLEQVGAPHTAYRDSLTFVGHHVYLVANSVYVKPIAPRVRCILAGWPDDTPWYPEKAEILASSLNSYDRYIEGEDGGPAIDYWWRLSGDLSVTPSANVGTGPSAPLTIEGTLTGALFDQAPVTLTTDDAKSVRRTGGYNSYLNAADLDVGAAPFTAGIWVNLNAADQIIFKSNCGGLDGNWRGLDLYIETSTPTRVSVVLGNNAGQHYRLQTAAGAFSLNVAHFVAVYCEPATDVLDVVLKLWVDGIEYPLSYYAGTATTVVWPTSPSSSSGDTGIAFDSKGDTYGGFSTGYRDQPLFHEGELTDAQVLEMYRRGAGLSTSITGDMNPAHIIYKAIVDRDQGQGEDASSIDADSFAYAADVAYAEGLGFSFWWRNAGPIKEFIAEVCQHAGFVRSINPRTGQYTLIPLRADYDPGDLDLITDADVLEVLEWHDAADGEAINQVTVKYRDREANKDDSATWTNRASVRQQGVSASVREYAGVSNYETALRIAKRDTREGSSNLSKGKLKVNRATWDKLPGAVFKFEHGPEDIDVLVLRVLGMDAGTDTDAAMTVDVVQDVFSLPLTVEGSAQQANEAIPAATTPSAITIQDALEIPWHWARAALGAAEVGTLDSAAGFGRPLAKKPQPLALGYDMWRSLNAGSYAEIATDLEWFYTAQLNGALSRSATSLLIDGSNINAAEVTAGYLLVVGTGRDAEWMRITGGNLSTGITVDRAILDTTPQEHADNARLWVLHPEFLLYDETEYTDADTVAYKMLTRTGAGVLSIGSATAAPVTLASRIARPYPPAAMTINAEAFPALLEGALTVDWSHRDGATQYPTIYGQDATDFGPAAGTTYNGYAYDNSDDTLLDSVTGLSGPTWAPTITDSLELRLELEAELDGLESWQRQVRVFDYLTTPARLDAEGDYRYDAEGEYLQEA